MDPAFQAAVDRVAARGQAAITMLEGVTSLAVFAVADAVREESREAVQRLHEQGIEVIMMAGDVRPVANAVAADLGILGFLGAASVRVWPIMSRDEGPRTGATAAGGCYSCLRSYGSCWQLRTCGSALHRLAIPSRKNCPSSR